MKLTKLISAFALATGISALTLAGTASAHVTVKPGEALTGQFLTFNVSVPVEKDIATTAVKLDIPEGLGHVTPTAKPGWTIQSDKQGEGEAAVVRSITWSGNAIEPGFRDDFSFSAKTPDEPTVLHWKALQTYADGTVVEWNLAEEDQPKKADGSPDFSKSGPFSVTNVLSETPQDEAIDDASAAAQDAAATATRALYLVIGAVILGFIAIFLSTRKKL